VKGGFANISSLGFWIHEKFFFKERSLQFSEIAYEPLGNSICPSSLLSLILAPFSFPHRQLHPNVSFLPPSLCPAPGSCRSGAQVMQASGRAVRPRALARVGGGWAERADSRRVWCSVARVAQAQCERSERGAARLVRWSERLARRRVGGTGERQHACAGGAEVDAARTVRGGCNAAARARHEQGRRLMTRARGWNNWRRCAGAGAAQELERAARRDASARARWSRSTRALAREQARVSAWRWRAGAGGAAARADARERVSD
jgi:hypothetical protein